MSLEKLKPIEVFKWFEQIDMIPRESGNEKQISDFLVNFAKERSLEVYQDKALNVIIKKSGTKGYENVPAVIIQGHMDMVCEKTKDSKHDFKHDPIKFIVEGDTLRADHTTLGGDDGIAVAYGLALLDAKDIPHPPLEILVTTSEETGMNGASTVTAEHLSGHTLINIDAEEEGIFLVSCAGGLNTMTEFNIKTEALKGKCIKITVSGLKGGHSGIEINKQRANAIKILGRVLYAVKKECNIVHINGGSKHNAIAKNAEAVIASENIENIKKIIESFSKDLKEEYRVEDPDMKIEIENISDLKEMFKKELTDEIIDFLFAVPDGVQYMSRDIEGLVQTSLNNGVLTEKDGKVTFTISIRSSVRSSLYEITSKIEDIGKRTNANVKRISEYPAWEYDHNSKVREIAIKTYKMLTGKEPKINAIHAGLECGLLKKVLPNADMISFGPNLYDVHTPEEHLSISSVERTWEFLKKLLENIK